MIKNLLIAGLLISATIMGTLWFESSFKSQKGGFFVLQEGQLIPDFSFESINGQTYSLSNFKGRAVVIHFWATWCPPCVVELPEIIKMAKDNPDSVILAISADRLEPVINRFFKMNMPEIPENFIVIHDKEKEITEGKFNVFKLPESFLLDQRHVLQRHKRGAYEGWQDLRL